MGRGSSGRPGAAVVAGLGALLELPEGVPAERVAELLMLASVPVAKNKVRGLYFCVGVQVRKVNVDKLDRLMNEETAGGRPAERGRG